MASTGKIEAFLAEPRNVVVAGIRRDGRPHLSPNWFYWDGERFYVSTTRGRVKYAIFRRDPRAQLLIDDSTGFRAVLVPATAEDRKSTRLNSSHPSISYAVFCLKKKNNKDKHIIINTKIKNS